MFNPFQWFRLIKIKLILIRYLLTTEVLGKYSLSLRLACYLNPWNYAKSLPNRGQALRFVCEELGPIFIKFAQMLSTRPDLIPPDIIIELEKLQDKVPPFPGSQAVKIVERCLQKPLHELFLKFDEKPLASASIAQVHAATLPNHEAVVVKILRPNIHKIIKQDIGILNSFAKLIEFFWSQGKRLHPVGLVSEFEQTIFDELDLMREAASASQLRRNFKDSFMMYVPKIYWDYVRTELLVMERISGVRVTDVNTLKAHHTNMKKLAEFGVEIFFTQVFRDNFFHADMHPGNLFVDVSDPETPKYLGVDFGIMGSLSNFDQYYLAENLLAFFDRDYRRVAILHVESGWVPKGTRVEQMEAAIRTVCEPIFEKPLSEISFGKLLLQLFVTAERFNMEIQPQLMLLQKTLLSIEGLGRQLYPQLNLWETAKPFMQRWIKKQYGLKNLTKTICEDWPSMSEKLAESPKTLLTLLENANQYYQNHSLVQENALVKTRMSHFFKLGLLTAFATSCFIAVVLSQLSSGLRLTPKYSLFSLALGGFLLLWSLKFRNKAYSNLTRKK